MNNKPLQWRHVWTLVLCIIESTWNCRCCSQMWWSTIVYDKNDKCSQANHQLYYLAINGISNNLVKLLSSQEFTSQAQRTLHKPITTFVKTKLFSFWKARLREGTQFKYSAWNAFPCVLWKGNSDRYGARGSVGRQEYQLSPARLEKRRKENDGNLAS